MRETSRAVIAIRRPIRVWLIGAGGGDMNPEVAVQLPSHRDKIYDNLPEPLIGCHITFVHGISSDLQDMMRSYGYAVQYYPRRDRGLGKRLSAFEQSDIAILLPDFGNGSRMEVAFCEEAGIPVLGVFLKDDTYEIDHMTTIRSFHLNQGVMPDYHNPTPPMGDDAVVKIDPELARQIKLAWEKVSKSSQEEKEEL